MQTILVTENEAPLRKMLASTLKAAGYHVLTASSGEDAVAAAHKHSGAIHLLITDIVMPGMGGADLYAWMKSERPDTAVLFISGFMNREPLPGAFLKKPFSAEALLAKVKELVP